MDSGLLRLEALSISGTESPAVTASAGSAEGLVVTGAVDGVRDLVIPDTVGGKRVLGIAPHAFAGNADLRFVSLPESIRFIGSFAFHNCLSLAKMELHDSITDYGDGSIRQCTALSDVRIAMHASNHEAVVRMLSDCDNTLTFTLDYPDGTALLTFPGYVYDFTENTMARTIQFNIEGSGMAFRDCVSRTGIDFAAYDRLFHRAKLDNIAVTVRLLLNRLMTPYALSSQAKALYEAYVEENAEAVLKTLVQQSDTEGIRFLVSEKKRHLLNKPAVSGAVMLASSGHHPEMTALLMDCAAAMTHAGRARLLL